MHSIIKGISGKSITLLMLLLLSLGAQVHADEAETGMINGEPYKTLTWDDLMPADFTLSMEDLYGPQSKNIDNLSDDSAQARQMLDHMQSVLDSAPIVPELNGKIVRIPGFVVPLEGEGKKMDRFFLVPYFGACIHVPPPPSNQIIDAHYDPGLTMDSISDAIWITGKITAERFKNELAVSGYRMEVYRVEPYTDEIDPQ